MKSFSGLFTVSLRFPIQNPCVFSRLLLGFQPRHILFYHFDPISDALVFFQFVLLELSGIRLFLFWLYLLRFRYHNLT